jgi:hypothetical protein
MLSGSIVVRGMIEAKRREGWTTFFLLMTGATSVTGFLFHAASFGPAQLIGVISLVTLAVAVLARYGYHLAGAWRWTYVASAVLALYLNVFVGVVQAFRKVPFLQPLAPTQSEPPFVITQAIVLVVFVALGAVATVRFYPKPVRFA